MQILWNLEVHLLRACARRQVPALLLRLEHGLAIPAGVVRHAVAGRGHPLQLELVQARLRLLCGVAQLLSTDAQLEVSLVVRRDLDHDLHDVARSKCGLGPVHVAQEVAVLPPLPPIATNARSISTGRAILVQGAALCASPQGRVSYVAVRFYPQQRFQQHCRNDLAPHPDKIAVSGLERCAALESQMAWASMATE